MVKSLPLYFGALLIAAAIAGAAMSLLRPGVRGGTASSSRPPEPSAALRTPAADELSPDQVKAQDEEDIIQILLEQIRATPSDIDDAWLAEFCSYVSDEAALDAFWHDLIEQGQKFDAVYVARHREPRTVLSRNPQYYVFEARDLIYTQEPDAEKLLGQGRSLLAMAVYRSWRESREAQRVPLAKVQKVKPEDVVLPDDLGEIDDEVKTSYFKESIRLYQLLADLAREAGDDPRQFTEDRIRLHEAAIVDGFLLTRQMTEEARARYRGSLQSSQPAMVAIRQTRGGADEHLLALGKIYVSEALAEKTFRVKQQQYANKGFQALAMVYQRSASGEALRVMRESNRILRYNLWQMARLSWKRAKAAAAAGRAEEADEGFFLAKQRYLRCLSLLERSKKPVVLDEYRRLQADINAWIESKRVAVAADERD